MGRKQGAFQVLYSTGDNDDSTRFHNDKINRQGDGISTYNSSYVTNANGT